MAKRGLLEQVVIDGDSHWFLTCPNCETLCGVSENAYVGIDRTECSVCSFTVRVNWSVYVHSS